MLRMATAKDLPALVELRRARYGGSRADAAGWLQNVAGLDHTLLVQAGGGPVQAMLAAVPVRYMHQRGVWFCGAAAADGVPLQTLLPRLLGSCLRAFAKSGAAFAVAAPQDAKQAKAMETLGFHNLLPTRVLTMPVRPNLLAQAEFDSLTVRQWMERRARSQPGQIALPEAAMNEVMTQLYRRGLTVVSSRRGYGLYLTRDGEMQFLELQADNDAAADALLQAAREKTGAQHARVLLAENQTLYQGAGRRHSCGMIAFLAEPFPVTDVYFRMLL